MEVVKYGNIGIFSLPMEQRGFVQSLAVTCRGPAAGCAEAQRFSRRGAVCPGPASAGQTRVTGSNSPPASCCLGGTRKHLVTYKGV